MTFLIAYTQENGFNDTRNTKNLAHFASHRCGPSSIPGLGRGPMCEKFHQLLAVGRWFPPGTPVSSTKKLISSSSFHRLDMTLTVAEALTPNKPINRNTKNPFVEILFYDQIYMIMFYISLNEFNGLPPPPPPRRFGNGQNYQIV